jgi:hypothetical protein
LHKTSHLNLRAVCQLSVDTNWLSFLSNESRSLLFQSLGIEAVPSMIDAGTTPKEPNFADWTLTPWGLSVEFADYQVGPYVIGSPSVLVPFQALTAVEREGGPLTELAATPPSRMFLLPAVDVHEAVAASPLNYPGSGVVPHGSHRSYSL